MQKKLSNIEVDLTNRIRHEINKMPDKLTDDEALDLIEEFVLHNIETKHFPYQIKQKIIQAIFLATRKELDLLQPYADDKTVNEIMVNGPDNIFIEKKGKIEKIEKTFTDKEQLEEIIRRIAGQVHKDINELNPILDARLKDGSRVNAVYRNVALDGPILTIRRFPEKKINMDELIRLETISKEAAEYLNSLVVAGYNIFISGGTSSGKTTFLNVLSNFIPKTERVVVIEDSAELQIAGIDNLVRLESRNANVQGKGEVTIRDLIKASLRMRPDRVIVGEVRGAEVVDMIQAMNTGHDGSLSTGHGNSPEGMLARLEAMFLMAAEFPLDAIRMQIAEAIDIIVHLARLPDRTRRVMEIIEVEGYKNGKIGTNRLFNFKRNGGLIPSGNKLKNRYKLEMKGVSLND